MNYFEQIMKIARNPSACLCGKKHELITKEILLENNALSSLPELVRKYAQPVTPEAPVLVICDENTFKAAGQRVEELLSLSGIPFKSLILKNGVIAAEEAVQAARSSAAGAGFLISVGSGTVTDVTRYTAAESGKSFISVPTAPSMDGYVSSVAAMTFGGCKVTTPSVPPVAVIADTAILARAPRRLLAAGVGNILGKFTCLCDWEIASLVSSETCCATLSALTRHAAEEVLQSCEGLARGGFDAVEKLTYALIASGLAMQLNGDSRPASGAEHHLSHFWEMRFLAEGREAALHGAKVGVATVIVSKIYHDAIPAFGDHLSINPPHFSITNIEKAFGGAAPGIIRENTPDPFAAVDIRKLFENREQIRRVVEKVPSSETFARALETLGAPVRPADLGIDRALEEDGLQYCIYVRRRLTLLRILSMLG